MRSLLTLAVFFTLVVGVVTSLAAEKISYSSTIQTIFAQKCLDCHGPDNAESGLRLDTHEHAIRIADSGEAAIVPGDADASELVRRVMSEDDDLRMPPDSEPLSDRDVDAIREWIGSGAVYDQHWAYRPLEMPQPPMVQQSSWVRNNIDRFVLAKLEANKISPSPEADRYTLIKRLAYDLHGLPPSVAAVDAFVKNASTDAYERLVDEMLSSPLFAERWGRHWLDKARYADSDGYEKDNHRADAWRYRDWVIEAIQNDMPYDRFTIEQIAGDLVPNRSELQMLATAFHRQTLTNTEGGTDREQWRVAAVMDRTETVASVWLGLTVGCARCHNHKYDQISQKEYYELYAYFDNADETSVDVSVSRTASRKYQDAQLVHQQQEKQLADELALVRTSVLSEQSNWEFQVNDRIQQALTAPLIEHSVEVVDAVASSGKPIRTLDDGSLLALHKEVSQDTYTLTIRRVDLPKETLSSLVLEVLPDDRLPTNGPGLAANGNFVLTDLRISDGQDTVAIASAVADFNQADWHVSHAVDDKPQTGWAVNPQVGKRHQATFVFAKPIVVGQEGLTVVLDQQHKQHLLGRFRIRLQSGVHPDTIAPKDIRAIVTKAAVARTADDRTKLTKYFLATNPIFQKSKIQYDSHLAKAPKPPRMRTRVLRERVKDRRQTNILRRGEFKQKLDPVSNGTLATITSGPEPSSRLEFANWLVNGNPVVPRVTANQVWDHLFGQGLVRTVNDFGVRGDSPTHPLLLDWLASQAIRLRWSRKQLIKTIVMSATYRQGSAHRDEMLASDPGNRLLYRQNRFRLEAEAIRDSCLSVAGLLSDKMGGPSVFPPIPSGITDLNYNSSFKWKTSTGEDRFRRGMYTYFKRTAPHPNLTTLDCPDSNVTCVKRDRSNTPLAALVTLNNAVFHEAAQAFALELLEQDLDTAEQTLSLAFRRCVARPPSNREIETLVELLQQSREFFANHRDDALRLIGTHASENYAAEEVAAWVTTIRMVLNLDEFITRE